MSLINATTPTTELEAVNVMLSVIGEAPVEDLTEPTQDVDIALRTLSATSRAVQLEGWRFNTEFGLEITPSGELEWEDTTGAHTRLYVFEPPERLARFSLSQSTDQIGMDVTIRPSKVYGGGGIPVFYDRVRNRDGFDAERVKSLYIDATFLFDFEGLPESARAYIVQLASRTFAEQVTGSETLSRLVSDTLGLARRTLEDDQGEVDDYNILDTLGARRAFGGRPLPYGGAVTNRNHPTFM